MCLLQSASMASGAPEVFPAVLPLAGQRGILGPARGYTKRLWRAVRPYFTGLSRSRFIMAEREGFSFRLQYCRLKSTT